MPTGYTAPITERGITFREFAMDCARAFGACIAVRDESGGGDAIPDEFKPSDYHEKRITELRAELAKVEAMTDDECEIASSTAYHEREQSRLKSLAKNERDKQLYAQMLDKVMAWIPPTPDHVGLKDFMLKQIRESMQFDCDDSDYLTTPTEMLSGRAWQLKELERIHKSLAWSIADRRKEEERCKQNTAWVRALRDSLAALEAGR